MGLARERKANTVSALERGIAVLRCFEAEARPMSNGEIARATGIPKPTVTRILATLAAAGYLRPGTEKDKYGLGAGILPLAQAFLRSVDVRAYARPHMAALAETLGGWAYLAVPGGVEMILIETCRAAAAVLSTRLDIGSRVPMPNSALGRAYLAALAPEPRAALLRELAALHGVRWAKLRAGLNQALKRAAADGYCMAIGTWHADVNTCAVVLPAPGGRLFGLLAGGPAYAFPEARVRTEVAPRLLAAASAIAAEIGSGNGV